MDEIILRALEPEDLDVLYSIENDIELWNVGYTTVPYSRYLLHDYIANSTCDIYADKQLRLLAETKNGGDVVGIVDITDYNPQHNRAELGLVVRRQYRNMGYGSIIVKPWDKDSLLMKINCSFKKGVLDENDTLYDFYEEDNKIIFRPTYTSNIGIKLEISI